MTIVTLSKIEVSAAPGGANVCVRGFVPLPLGPLPTLQEQNEKFEAAISQLKLALPELIPLLVLEIVESQTKFRLPDLSPNLCTESGIRSLTMRYGDVASCASAGSVGPAV